MAILQHNDLAFELRFLDYEDGDFLLYEIGFLCRDEPLLNPATLPAQPTVRTGYFIASENIGDRFIAFLDWVLENDKPDCWEPLEEEVRIALAPGYSFPFSKYYLDGPGAGERNDANGNPLPGLCGHSAAVSPVICLPCWRGRITTMVVRARRSP